MGILFYDFRPHSLKSRFSLAKLPNLFPIWSPRALRGARIRNFIHTYIGGEGMAIATNRSWRTLENLVGGDPLKKGDGVQRQQQSSLYF